LQVIFELGNFSIQIKVTWFFKKVLKWGSEVLTLKSDFLAQFAMSEKI
jgi:hypothetical protein